MKRPTETDLVRNCLDFLKLHSIFSWRCNSGGGLRRGRGGRTVPVVGNPAGTPDILAVCPVAVATSPPLHLGGAPTLDLGTSRTLGRLVGIECKLPGRKRRPAQQAWAANALAAGVLCLLVEDVRDLEQALRRQGYIS